jgi:hypothetical protein
LSCPCSLARWLIVSPQQDCPLSSICTPSPGNNLQCISLTYSPLQLHMPSACTEVVAGCEHHLHALFGSVAVDQMLCAQPPPLPATQQRQNEDGRTAAGARQQYSSDEFLNQAYLLSMAWAYTAKEQAGMQCGTVLITHDHHHMMQEKHRRHAALLGDQSQAHPTHAAGTAALKARLFPSLAQGVHKTYFMEHRSRCGPWIDLQGDADTKPAVSWLQWACAASQENAMAFRSSRTYVQRLLRQRVLARQRHRRMLRPDMACVVIGGTRGLGLQHAKQLAREGCRNLVISSRSGVLEDSELQELIRIGG